MTHALNQDQVAAYARLARLDTSLLHVAGPVKCYYGAFDSHTQSTMNLQNSVTADLRKFYQELHITYYPSGSFYTASSGWKIVTEEMPSHASVLCSLVKQVLEKYK